MRLLATAFTAHSSFSSIASRYDAFILDQFGVMHNGKSPLPGAPELVRVLSGQKGKKLIILSNTSSPSRTALGRLPGLGFDPEDFVGAVTSGEEASRLIRTTYGAEDGGGGEPKKFVWFTWAPGNDNAPPPLRFVEQCGNVEPARTAEEADFVVAHGSGVVRGPGSDGEAEVRSMGSFIDTGDMTEIDAVLSECRERNLPLICANPDRVVYHGSDLKHMPGKIAERYESHWGGDVRWFGKPDPDHFEACLRELGLERDRVAHVGDSLHHDVAGANAAGIPSVFVCGGIHCEELGVGEGAAELPSNDALRKLFDGEGHTPTHVVPTFSL